MDVQLAVSAVRAATARVEEALEGVAVAKQALQHAALKALVEVDGDATRERELIRLLYWDVPLLPVKTIEAAVGTAARVRELAGPGPVLATCEGCGAELRATSRTQLAAGLAQCRPCERRRQEAAIAQLGDPWPGPPEDDIPAQWYEDLDRMFGPGNGEPAPQ